ncbi:MAG: histone deacetylase superfamily [Acidobacteria bacterium]|nr:histone deacetylase superfamily [Acidobacteriota bacterium]
MKVVYAARYQIDIGPHVFPTRKYSLILQSLLDAGVIQPSDCLEPDPAGWDDLALVHTSEYLTKMRHGAMSAEDTAQLELPWSIEMVEGFRLMVGGTITAARIACGLDEFSIRHSEFGIHLGGGLHHAFPNHGEGFCPFNDVAVAARVLQARGIERIAIVDLDVHHGNGTAFTFESDPRVFTFSMHQQHNYPMWKPRGSLDIGLSDGAHDATFLSELARALPRVMAHAPQCVFYLAGADPYEDDQLGGLRLTRAGLRERDRMVIAAVRAAGVPLVITLAGGYARHVEDTVAIHAATIEEAVTSGSNRRDRRDR